MRRQPIQQVPSSGFSLYYDPRARGLIYQTLAFGLVAWLGWYLFTNTAQNLEARGMTTGFGFLTVEAGFDTDFKIIRYKPLDSYGRVYLLGIANTLFISFLVIVGCTVLGAVVGIARLSPNWLVAKLASGYVELLRNIPLLNQVVYWYLGIFSLMPRTEDSVDLFKAELAFINNRGLYAPTPQFEDRIWITLLVIAVAVVATFGVRRWARRRQALSGRTFPVVAVDAALLIGLPGLAFVATGRPLSWDVPVFGEFNFHGGVRIPPSFLALFCALTVYFSAYMAEAVRAGIQAVPRGQREAANSLGLPYRPTLRLVVLPQALRAIVPPTIIIWMSVVKASSLGAAIGYPEIGSLYMQTSINQTGYAIEMVAMTMGFYMVISLALSACLNLYNKRVRITEG